MKLVSDGTKAGTKLNVNGNDVENMMYCSFHCYSEDSAPYFSYSTETMEDEKSGLVRMDTYYLADKYKMEKMKDKEHKYIGEANMNGVDMSLFKITKHENRK